MGPAPCSESLRNFPNDLAESMPRLYAATHLPTGAGSKALSKAGAELAELGNGQKPKDGGEALTDTSGVAPARAVLGMAGLVMAASLLVMVRLVRIGQVE
jgi:hypothetical protein